MKSRWNFTLTMTPGECSFPYVLEQWHKKYPNCRFCQQPESLLHIFYEFPNARELWNNIEKLLKDGISLEIKFSCFTVIFGYVNRDQNHIPINNLILVTKKYILDKSVEMARDNLKPPKHRLNSLTKVTVDPRYI